MSRTIQTLTQQECSKMLTEIQSCGKTYIGQRNSTRNYVIALFMLDAGLRVGEVVQLRVSDIWFNHEPLPAVTVTAEISKSNRSRTIPLSARLKEGIKHLFSWFDFNDAVAPHFFAFHTNTPSSHITVRQVQRFIQEAAMVSLHKCVHPHILRHTFASNLMRITSVRVVQELLGHKQLSSTQVYMHPNSDDLSKAINAVSSCSL